MVYTLSVTASVKPICLHSVSLLELPKYSITSVAFAAVIPLISLFILICITPNDVCSPCGFSVGGERKTSPSYKDDDEYFMAIVIENAYASHTHTYFHANSLLTLGTV